MKRIFATLFMLPGTLLITIAGLIDPQLVGLWFLEMSREIKK